MEGSGTQTGVFVLACLAQKAKNYKLAARGWERYVLLRYAGVLGVAVCSHTTTTIASYLEGP